MDEKELERVSSFAKTYKAMIATNTKTYGKYETYTERTVEYTKDEIQRILSGKSLQSQQKLSRDYFNQDGFYKRLILYYATVLEYQGILIPNPSFGQQLSKPYIQKKYYSALDLVENFHIPNLAVNCAVKALINGCYYGIIRIIDKNKISILDLPASYCRTRFKDLEGNDIIEFDVRYFNSIVLEEDRKLYLSAYPKEIIRAYKAYMKGKRSDPWVFLSTSITLCIPFFNEGQPFFLCVLDDIEKYKDAVDNEIERDLEEIRKIIVQHIPHMNDGRLVFEPQEAEEMHAGAVGMLRSNPNISVLTTYADVDAIVSKTTSENTGSNLEKMVQNIYSESGASGQIFSSTGSATLETSIKNDIALMMIFANKLSLCITNTINRMYSNSNINFKYEILPISYYTDDKYIDKSFKLAGSGYSLILPSLALGISQRDLVNIKDLENEVLSLKSKLIPPDTSYTQSSKSGQVGAPAKEEADKSPKTLENEKSLDNQTEGGSN